MGDIQIIAAATTEDVAAASRLFREYANSLDFSLEFQGFSAELASLPGKYEPPTGCILLAMDGSEAVGCVAIREIEPSPTGRVCEMKRLYVQPKGRGRRIGHVLCKELIARARALGYERMKLDTSDDMHAAQAVYRGLGFRPCERYNNDPCPCTLYFELPLQEKTPQ